MGSSPKSKHPLHDPAYRQMQELLRGWRKQAGLTQRELGKLLKTDQSIIAKSELGERRIDPIELVRWLRACKVQLAEGFLEVAAVVKR